MAADCRQREQLCNIYRLDIVMLQLQVLAKNLYMCHMLDGYAAEQARLNIIFEYKNKFFTFVSLLVVWLNLMHVLKLFILCICINSSICILLFKLSFKNNHQPG